MRCSPPQEVTGVSRSIVKLLVVEGMEDSNGVCERCLRQDFNKIESKRGQSDTAIHAKAKSV